MPEFEKRVHISVSNIYFVIKDILVPFIIEF